MRSPGEIQIRREENQLQWEDTEFEAAKCGPHGDPQETSGNPGLETWASHHGIIVIPGIPTFTQTTQTRSEELAPLEVHGTAGWGEGGASRQPPTTARTQLTRL